MALSKLKVNQVDREKLYFNKYTYRGIFETKHLYYIYDAKTIDEYRSNLSQARDNSVRYSWRRTILDDTKIDFDLIEKIITFKRKYSGKNITFRCEGDKMSVFSNDDKVLSDMAKIQPNAKLVKILPSPVGIKYFKKDPPSKYRVYLKSSKISEDTRDSLRAFISRDLAMPSESLRRSLASQNQWKWSYVHDGHFINYNEETTLSYMGLMFPEIIGKVYKLEKKTD